MTGAAVKFAGPDADLIIRADVIAGAAQVADESFLNPSFAGAAGYAPASITNGATEIVSSGTTAALVSADLRRLVQAVSTNLTAPYFVMTPRTAAYLASLDAHRFRDVRVNGGGNIWGIPIIVTTATPADGNSPADDLIVLIDAAELLLADPGEATVEVAEPRDYRNEHNPGFAANSFNNARFLVAAGSGRMARQPNT